MIFLFRVSLWMWIVLVPWMWRRVLFLWTICLLKWLCLSASLRALTIFWPVMMVHSLLPCCPM
ncbi:MAG: hypothetical protein COA73_02895, partial [Candidatus Hydrogenedentota bacterium]